MDKDYYSILGVTPASEEVVIRAAYRALMRRYHPDADASAEAAERAREINEAYAVLSDPEKRARYDGAGAAQSVISFEPASEWPPEGPRRSVLAPVAGIGFAALAAGMVAFALSPPADRQRLLGLPTQSDHGSPQVASTAEVHPAKAKSDGAAALCSDPNVRNLIRDELFRRAAPQPVDREKLEASVAAARIRIESPALDGERACKGWVALDLPPGVAADGRTNLNAEIGYEIVRANDGRLSLAGLAGVNALVRSIRTAGPVPREPQPVEVAPSVRIAQAKESIRKVAAPVVVASTSPKVLRPSKQQPLVSKCSSEPNVASRLICSSDNLASLDRQLASFYRQSWDKADETKRAALLGSRPRFNERRNACGTQTCMTGVYVARLREISDIMAGRKQR